MPEAYATKITGGQSTSTRRFIPRHLTHRKRPLQARVYLYLAHSLPTQCQIARPPKRAQKQTVSSCCSPSQKQTAVLKNLQRRTSFTGWRLGVCSSRQGPLHSGFCFCCLLGMVICYLDRKNWLRNYGDASFSTAFQKVPMIF